MESTTISDLQKSIDKLMNEPNPPLRLHSRESSPEIKAPLAQTMKDLALLVIEKRNNAKEWKNFSSSQGDVYDDRDGGVSQRINGLEINVAQRSDSSVSINIFDEALADASLYKNIPATDRDCEFQLVDTNSRGEVVSFLPSHSIYERMGMDKEEFASLVLTRLEGMADKIDRQVAIEQEIPLALDSTTVINGKVLEQEVFNTVLENQGSWAESLRAQIGDVAGSKLQIFSGASKVYERNSNEVVLDNLEGKLGQKVQQALKNPSQLKGSVRVVVDRENIFYAKDGELLNNTCALAIENTQAISGKSLDTALVIPQVDSVQLDDEQQATSLGVALVSSQVIEVREQSIQATQEESLNTAVKIPEVIEVQQSTIEIAQVESLDTVPKISKAIEPENRNVQAALLSPEPQQKPSQKAEAKVSFAPPQEIVVPVKNQQQDSNQRVQPIDTEAKEKAIFNLIARQETRINLLEQKLAAQAQPLNVKVNQWLGAANQIVKDAVKEVRQKSLHIPPFVRSFVANKANEIQTNIKEQVKTTRTSVVNKVTETVSAVRTEVIGKVNEVKSGLERQLADVAGASLNASTRYLAERFGVDNGAGIKVFQGNSLVITSSVEHSGIYSKDGKQLVRDGQFVAPVTREQLNKIAQVQPEAQKLSQLESTVRAKALR